MQAAHAPELPDPVPATLQRLAAREVGCDEFFGALTKPVAVAGLADSPTDLGPCVTDAPEPGRVVWNSWRDRWWTWCRRIAPAAATPVAATLQRWNVPETPVRPVIEGIRAAIDRHDDRRPLRQWLTGCSGGPG